VTTSPLPLHSRIFTEGQFFPEWVFQIDDIVSEVKAAERINELASDMRYKLKLLLEF
jgi:hypothetical protein